MDQFPRASGSHRVDKREDVDLQFDPNVETTRLSKEFIPVA